MIQHCQQLRLVGMQPFQQAIQGNEAGAAAEDIVEPFPQMIALPWRRAGAVVLQIGIELPDQRADMLLCGALLVRESLKLVYEPFAVDPAQCVLPDGELAGPRLRRGRLRH